MKKTVIIGASDNAHRYSYAAAKFLHERKIEFIPIGKHEGEVFGEEILQIKDEPNIKGVDTITLYINAANQQKWYDYLLGLKPKRIIFNPGAENEELKNLAEKKGIQTEYACTLVMLSTGQY